MFFYYYYLNSSLYILYYVKYILQDLMKNKILSSEYYKVLYKVNINVKNDEKVSNISSENKKSINFKILFFTKRNAILLFY